MTRLATSLPALPDLARTAIPAPGDVGASSEPTTQPGATRFAPGLLPVSSRSPAGAPVARRSTVSRRQLVDAIIDRNRAATTPAEANQRSVKRATIAELSDLDHDEIIGRVARSRHDDRPTVVKVLDLIDLPRNAIFNLVWPEIAARKREEGDMAARGLPRVTFSDVLDGLGVENRVARAVVGFVGDVALDPLTYLGPAGFGLRIGARVGTGTATATLSASGRRAFNQGVKAAAVAGPSAVRDDAVRNLILAFGFTDEAVGRLTAQGIDVEGAIRKAVSGPISTGKVGRGLSRIGGDIETTGGGFAKRLGQQVRPEELTTAAGRTKAAQVDASRELLARYERSFGSQSGNVLRVGRGGSQVLHVPFTGINVQVPAFTAAGRTSIALGQLAKVAANAPDVANGLQEAARIAENAIDLVRAETVAASAEPARLRADADTVRAMRDAGDAEGAARQALAGIDHANLTAAEQAQRLESVTAAAEALRNYHIPNPEASPEAVLQLAQLRRLTAEAAGRARSLERSLGKAREARALYARVADAAGDVDPADIEAADAAIDAVHDLIASASRLRDQTGDALRTFITPEESELIELTKLALGTNDETIGASLLTPVTDAWRMRFGPDSTVLRALESVDNTLRTVFGVRSGMLHRQLRYLERAQSQGMERAKAHAAAEIASDLGAIAQKYGVEDGDQLAVLAYAKLIQSRGDAHHTATWVDGVGEIPYEDAARYGQKASLNVFAELEKARKSGLLQNKDLDEAMTELGQRYAHALDDLGEYAQEAGLLDGFLSGYVPIVPNEEGRAVFRDMRRAFPRTVGSGSTSVERVGVGGVEAFQKARSTYQSRFIGADGKARRFFEFERAYAAETDEAIEALLAGSETEKALGRRLRLLKDDIAEYDAMENAPPPRPTDAFELNDLVAKGRFTPITGDAPLTAGLFSTSIFDTMATRVAAQRRATANLRFRDMIDGMGESVTIPLMDFQKAAMRTPGREFVMGDGRTGMLGNPVNGMPTVILGNKVYRRLNPNLVSSDNPIRGALDAAEGMERLWLDRAAETIERAARVFGSEDATREAFKVVDQLTGWWKVTTLMHPSWPITELVGNATLWLTGNVRPQDVTKHGLNAFKLHWAQDDPAKLARLTFNVGGRRLTGEQLLDMADRFYADTSRGAETVAMLGKEKWYSTPPKAGEGVSPRDALWSKASGEKAVKTMGDTVQRRLVGPWFRFDAKLNNAMRTIAFLSFLEQGDDVVSAGRRTVETLYDMTDLTRIESDYLRRFGLPFYTWIRNNMAYQTRMLFERPVYAASFPKVKAALEEAINGEDNVPEHMRPGWMRDQLALQIGKDPHKRWSVLMRSGVPIGDAYEAASAVFGREGMQDFLTYMVGGGNPVFKVPVEVAAGREIFSGREIGPDETRGDLTMFEHLANQVRPIREIGLDLQGPLSREFRRGAGAGAARFTAGGRAQAFDEERLVSSRIREFSDRERGIRAAIRRADRDGDASARSEAIIDLLTMYRRMQEVGLGEEVPVWAQERLALLTSADG